ncbi:hypothetical protein [Nocardia arizonensis]|uniref:hypothetical protein n=1 Tax=Nocardia arizonensis TaxID=1141647 RepID=UPI0006D2BB40|nr:hypothetical protein [Nocardia arizonensis]
MIALLPLLILACFGYAIVRYAPPSQPREFRLDRFRPRGTLTEGSRSHYDEQRRYVDLAAIHGRAEPSETTAAARTATAGDAVKASFG